MIQTYKGPKTKNKKGWFNRKFLNPIPLVWLPIWHDLLFSLYLGHGFCSESEDVEGNRFKSCHNEWELRERFIWKFWFIIGRLVKIGKAFVQLSPYWLSKDVTKIFAFYVVGLIKRQQFEKTLHLVWNQYQSSTTYDDPKIVAFFMEPTVCNLWSQCDQRQTALDNINVDTIVSRIGSSFNWIPLLSSRVLTIKHQWDPRQ